MTEYRRAYIPGGSWFFTVNLAERKSNQLLVEKIDLLRNAFEYTKQRYPFRMDAVVILPDHCKHPTHPPVICLALMIE